MPMIRCAKSVGADLAARAAGTLPVFSLEVLAVYGHTGVLDGGDHPGIRPAPGHVRCEKRPAAAGGGVAGGGSDFAVYHPVAGAPAVAAGFGDPIGGDGAA